MNKSLRLVLLGAFALILAPGCQKKNSGESSSKNSMSASKAFGAPVCNKAAKIYRCYIKQGTGDEKARRQRQWVSFNKYWSRLTGAAQAAACKRTIKGWKARKAFASCL